ncbi:MULTISPECIES: DUF4302 domain-containing protein [Sphingobacterium]|uniref:DUF4302 domain-containing protein n=1 Tax=Sphingobacterium TaxID=28453 RepID=UPI00257E1E46|nr:MULTISPECIES: DUF4302 domain-containing protein [Sphingobacterium]
MKLKYLVILILLPFLMVTSCKRDDDRIFDTNATVRMTEAVQQAYTVLQANKAGWMMKFYPSNNQEFGGYTIFSKFISNAEVTLASDPFTGSETSSYSISPESGPVLTFNGYNKQIHWFSEPGMDNGGIGADDSGMRGDFEFIVLKATADSVVLKGKKSGSHLVMLPLKEGEFERLSTTYQEAADKFKQFMVYKLETSGNKTVRLGYDAKFRVFHNPTDELAVGMAFRVVPKGLEFYQKYTLAGTSFDFLNYVEPTSGYPNGYYTDEGKTFKILPSTPLNFWFKNNLWSMSFNNTGAFGKLYWTVGKGMLAKNNIIVNNAYIGGTSGVYGLIFNLQNGAVFGGVSHFIEPVEDTEDEVYIELEGYVLGNFPLAYWSGGINYLSAPFDQTTFKITSADGSLTPTAITLTDVTSPTNSFKLFLKDIDDPLNN